MRLATRRRAGATGTSVEWLRGTGGLPPEPQPRAEQSPAAQSQAEQSPAAQSQAGHPQPMGDVRLQARWTGGTLLATRTATAVLWSALVAGPLALVLAVLVVLSGPGTSADVAAPAADHSAEQAAVEEFAQRFVVTWLQTPQGQEAQLAPYVQVVHLTLPEVPWQADAPATASVGRLGAGRWSVTVAVSVSAPGSPTRRRYFQVPVSYVSGGGGGGAMVAAALPAPVAAPIAAAAPELAYRYRADPAGPVVTSIGEFLTALLTGQGDVTRYVSPGTVIAAVNPPPYTAVAVSDVMVDRDVAGGTPPTSGQRLAVLATARVTAGPNQQIDVQYALTLLARAGRWEVQAVDPSPQVVPTAATNSGTQPNR